MQNANLSTEHVAASQASDAAGGNVGSYNQLRPTRLSATNFCSHLQASPAANATNVRQTILVSAMRAANVRSRQRLKKKWSAVCVAAFSECPVCPAVGHVCDPETGK